MDVTRLFLCLLYVASAFVNVIECAAGLLYQDHLNVTNKFHLVLPERALKAQFNSPSPFTNTLQLLVYPSVHPFTISLQSTKPDYVSINQDSLTVVKCDEHNASSISQINIALTSQQKQNNNASGEYTFSNSSLQATTDPTNQHICYDITFQAYGRSFGYSTLVFSASYGNTTNENEGGNRQMIGSVVIACTRYYRTVDRAFRVSVYVLVSTSLFGMGNELNWQVIKAHLKRPKAPLIALVSQYTIMPALALAIIYLMGYSGGYALGLFTYGCSPGGGPSNMYSKLLNGDMTLSVTMTSLSTMASIGMMPLYIYTLGRLLPENEEIGKVEIPFLNLFLSLLAIVIPLSVGVLFQYKLPRASLVVKKILKVFFFLIITFFLTVGVYSNLYIYQSFNLALVGSAMILPIGGYLFGGLLAWACRMDWKLIKTISLETGMQNVGVAILIVQTSLQSPESDLAIIPVLAATLVTGLPCLPISLVYTLYQRCRKRSDDKKSSTSSNMTKIGEVDRDKELLQIDVNGTTLSSAAEEGEKGDLLEVSASGAV